MLTKCSPVTMRANLEKVEVLKQAGIDFVAVPVRDAEHKRALLKQSMETLIEMANTTNESTQPSVDI